MRIDFQSKSYLFSKNEILTFFNKLRTSKTYTQGKYLKEFEEKLSKYHNNINCLAVSNAVSGMEMIVDVLNLKKDDEIIIPAHTYLASAYPFLRKTNKIKWSDIDLRSRLSNLDLIKSKITKKTKVIVLVHLYGYMVDLKPIVKFAKEKKIILIEDAAQSIGCSIDEKKAGTFGDFSIISFQSQKNISTLGEGGALLYKNSKYTKIFSQLRHNGHEPYTNQIDYWKPAMTNAVLPNMFNRSILPHNFCLPELSCIAGIHLLKKINLINNIKRKNANYFFKKIKNLDNFIHFNKDLSLRNNFHLMIGFCKNVNRDKLIKLMNTKYKIKCITQYYPLYKYTLFKNVKKQKCLNTELFYKNMISIPFHYYLSFEEINYISNSLIKSVKELIET
tara:strand:+ start:5769 stop:6938 length:1170 start_codon:yes stop_codon:yes gene_type:complete